METIPTGVTWEEVLKKFEESDVYCISLNQHSRRANLHKRKKGVEENRKLWRLFVQRKDRDAVTTLYKKNIHEEGDDLLSKKADDKIINRINYAISH